MGSGFRKPMRWQHMNTCLHQLGNNMPQSCAKDVPWSHHALECLVPMLSYQQCTTVRSFNQPHASSLIGLHCPDQANHVLTACIFYNTCPRREWRTHSPTGSVLAGSILSSRYALIGPYMAPVLHSSESTHCPAGTQHAFCKAHMSVLNGEERAAVCGSGWPASPLPKVTPGVAKETAEVQMIAYKPGAGQLPAHWSRPHRFAQQHGPSVLHNLHI